MPPGPVPVGGARGPGSVSGAPRPRLPASPTGPPWPGGPPRCWLETLGWFGARRPRNWSGSRGVELGGGGGPSPGCGPSRSGSRLQELKDPGDRDLDPARSIVQLIAELVDGLLQQHSVEQDLDLPPGPGEEGALRGCLHVGAKEGSRHPLVPEKDPRLEEGGVLLRRGSDPSEQPRVGRVVERSEHPGNVAKGRSLDAPLRQRPCRFPFEVDDHEVLSRVQDLTEVEVAVHPDPLGVDLGLQEPAEPPPHGALQVQELDGLGYLSLLVTEETEHL